MSTSLAELPVELLDQIVSHFETARTVSLFSRTCKRLHDYVEKDGFRSFVHGSFPSIQTPPYWKDAAHALTTLSKAWDRKAIVARCIYPEKDVIQLPRKQGRPLPTGPQRGQTMGYRPVIDCYEEVTGGSWISRKEVLAWGAGAELEVRVKCMGKDTERAWLNSPKDVRATKYDQFRHRNRWIRYKEDAHQDGRDDITSVNILRPSQKPTDDTEHVIIGRASGELACVSLSAQSRTLTQFTTDERPVQSAHISSTAEPLLAACLSNGTVALYPMNTQSPDAKPCKELEVIPSSASGRTWTSRFLNPNRLAVGLGPSPSPIHVYDISKSQAPMRKFTLPHKHTASDPRPNPPPTSSVYAVAPLDPSSQASSSAGDVFVSGWYHGAVMLHDLRSPAFTTAKYIDPIDSYSAIYSLLPIGHERIIAGSARHSVIKVFDLRMTGGRVYFAANTEARKVQTAYSAGCTCSSKFCCCACLVKSKPNQGNYNVFLQKQSRGRESPVYALTSGAAYSPRIYAGLEGKVMQLDIVSMIDQFPDQAFGGNKWVGSWPRGTRLKERYDPDRKVQSLAALEQTTTGAMKIRNQVEVGKRGASLAGWDERWV
ncbi:hypothetical protein MMC30_001254 [Trapelia coarctata]|nr:hypothetical protein [Trapelia coarctata]